MDLTDRRHVDGGRKRIIGRLAAVDMIIGMNQRITAAWMTRQLIGAIGQHLVHVHVALCARASLPDHQRKLIIPLPVDHLISGLHNPILLLRANITQRSIGLRSGFFHQGHGMNHR